MTEIRDVEHLKRYLSEGSEEAFEAIIRQHVNLVFSTALRHVGNPEDAKEVTQAVFILLSQKASGLHQETILSGWLYQAARLTSISFLRGEQRRQRRELEALMQSIQDNSQSDPNWEKMAAHLDEGMARLSDKERTALVLRFFEGRTFPEIASILNQQQSAVQKRVNRSLEKLRAYLVRQGVNVSSAGLSGAMQSFGVQAVSSEVVTNIITGTACKGAAAKGSTHLLIQQTLKLYAKAKLKTALTAVASLLAIGTASVFLLNQAGAFSFGDDPHDTSVFEIRSTGINNGAPWVLVVSNATTKQLEWTDDNEKTAGAMVSLVWLIGQAYGISPARMILPHDWPRDASGFFLSDLSPSQKKVLQNKIKWMFLLEAKSEPREVEAIELGPVKSPGPSLRLSDGGQPGIQMFKEAGHFSATNVTAATLTELLENHFVCPVINKIESTNKFSLSVRWKAGKGATGRDALASAIREQLGFEVKTTRAVMPILVVRETQP